MSAIPSATVAKPKRRRSGTADWHMSREAVSLSVPQVFAWTDRECLDFMVEVRFGSWNTVGCIRGSITQMDDNSVRKNNGGGIATSFFDFGLSADVSYDLISMDMSIGDASSRKILPQTRTSNTMVITKTGKSGEAGAKIGKVGLAFNMDFSRSEGLGATTRSLIELGMIETLGKFTQVPYWCCLDADITNPVIREQALETFDTLKEREKVSFVQGKLGVQHAPLCRADRWRVLSTS